MSGEFLAKKRVHKPNPWKGNRSIIFVIVYTWKGEKNYGKWYTHKSFAETQLEHRTKAGGGNPAETNPYTIERMSRDRLSKIHLKRTIANLVAVYDDEDKQAIIAALKGSA